MSRYILKKVHLKNPKLINLRNGLRSILFKKVYSTMKEIRPFDKELYTYCYSFKVKLSSKEFNDLDSSLDSIRPDIGKSGKEIIADIKSFLEEMKNSDLDDKEKYIRCRFRTCEIARYLQGLDELLEKSIVRCLHPLCRDPSKTDMYRIPDLGTGHSWENAWVCPEHVEEYRSDIIQLYSIDITKLKHRVELTPKTIRELEAYYNP